MNGCSPNKSHVNPNELLTQINAKKAPIIIDVRSQYEYNASHIPGAIHIPFWTAFTTSQLNQTDKTQILVVYCEHGPRAGVAKMAFSLSGFDNIYYLQGHMSKWKAAKLPVESVVD